MPTNKNIMTEEEQLIGLQKQEVKDPLYDAISEALAEDSKRPNKLSASAINKIVEGRKHETEDPLYDGISKALADFHLSENLNPEVIGFSINKN
jgi:hypothetical protein